MSMFRREKPEQVVITVRGDVEWRYVYDEDAKVYVGFCDALNLNSIGETFIDFQQSASEAMALLLTSLLKAGELEAFVKQRGWSMTAMPEHGTTPRFDMPFRTHDTRNVRELVAFHA